MGAAVAIECAARDGHRSSMHEALFENLAAPAPLSWLQVALNAGVRDSIAFTRCLSDDHVLVTIRDDIAAAAKLGIRGTPLVLLDSFLIEGAPTADYLRRYSRSLQADNR